MCLITWGRTAAFSVVDRDKAVLNLEAFISNYFYALAM
jgi:hypothetical protein